MMPVSPHPEWPSNIHSMENIHGTDFHRNFIYSYFFNIWDVVFGSLLGIFEREFSMDSGKRQNGRRIPRKTLDGYEVNIYFRYMGSKPKLIGLIQGILLSSKLDFFANNFCTFL